METSNVVACATTFKHLCLSLIVDLEVSKLVRVVLVCHDAKEITQLLLLQVLLGEVLYVSLREGDISSNVDFVLLPSHSNVGTQVASFAIYFNAIDQKLLQSGWVDDIVVCRGSTIQKELGLLAGGALFQLRLLLKFLHCEQKLFYK